MLGSVLIAFNRPWIAAALVVPLPVIAAAAHPVVIPRFGASGVAGVTMALAILAALTSMTVVSRMAGVRVPGATAARCLVIGGAAFAGAVAWPAPGPLVLIKAVVLAAGIVAGLLATGELNADERAALRRAPGTR